MKNKKLIKDLGNLFEEEENAEKIIKDMDRRLKILQEKITKVHSGKKPKNSYVHFLLEQQAVKIILLMT